MAVCPQLLTNITHHSRVQVTSLIRTNKVSNKRLFIEAISFCLVKLSNSERDISFFEQVCNGCVHPVEFHLVWLAIAMSESTRSPLNGDVNTTQTTNSSNLAPVSTTPRQSDYSSFNGIDPHMRTMDEGCTKILHKVPK